MLKLTNTQSGLGAGNWMIGGAVLFGILAIMWSVNAAGFRAPASEIGDRVSEATQSLTVSSRLPGVELPKFSIASGLFSSAEAADSGAAPTFGEVSNEGKIWSGATWIKCAEIPPGDYIRGVMYTGPFGDAAFVAWQDASAENKLHMARRCSEEGW